MRTRIPSFLFVEHILRAPANSQRLIVLMHGYEQTGQKILEKLEPVLPKDATILAPNGPFPVPKATDTGYRVGYSWYFYDPTTDEYLIDMEIGAHFIASLIKELKLDHLSTTIIGYSQGGYLAPFAASVSPQVKHVIGISCEFLAKELTLPISFRMDSIHGAEDEIVSPQGAQKSHQELLHAGISGEFFRLENSGHRIDDPMRKKLGELLV